MEDPLMSSPTNKALFFFELSEQNSNPTIPAQFIENHFNGKIQSTNIKLTSDTSDRTWKVELEGGRFSDGWKDFSVFHCVKDDDVLSFRHDGDMVFHVTPFGRSFTKLQIISSSSDDDDDDDAGDYADDYYYDYSDKISSKKKTIIKTESSKSYFLAHVTRSSLSRDTKRLVSKFARSNSLERRHCEIDLLNEHGKSWTLLLQHQKQTGQAYICRGWRSFCCDNGIKAGSFCRFKLVQSGTKPVLQLCPEGNTSKANNKRNATEIESEDIAGTVVPMHQNKIVTLVFKTYMLVQFRLPPSFTRENHMKEGEITVVNKDGVVWKLLLVNVKGRDQFYIKGCKELFVANNIKNDGESFTMEVIQGGTSPILKIGSPQVQQASSSDGYKTQEKKRLTVRVEERENQVQKKARVFEEDGPSRQTKASNKTSDDHPGNFERKKELESRSISDHVKELKEVIGNTLTDLGRIRSEVEEKEQKLKIALEEIEALEEKIMGISKVFNVNQV